MVVLAGNVEQGRTRRLFIRLSNSLPSPWTILVGSVLAGALMGLSILTGLYLRNGIKTFSPGALLLLYSLGSAAGFGPGLTLANFACGGMQRPGRFVFGTIILFRSLHTATATIFALQYRVFYSHWHADFPSIPWFFQLVFTSAAAVYQFTVDSLFLYWPLGPAVFLGLGLWFAARETTA